MLIITHWIVGKASDILGKSYLNPISPKGILMTASSSSTPLIQHYINGKVVDQRGPYLLSGNWWDENAWAHAEWDLQLENGALCRGHRTGETWEVAGVYD